MSQHLGFGNAFVGSAGTSVSEEDVIEKLPLAGPIRQFVAAFVDAHYHPEPFKKRVRDRANLDARVGGRADPRLRRQ